MIRCLKGILVGIGGVAPGLSGSVLLIIFGLYRQTLDALGTLFQDFKKKIQFLLPLGAGMVLGVLMFSKVIDFFLNRYEMPTRFCFLGLILGTLPMVWKEVRKEGFRLPHGAIILAAAGLGIWFFAGNPGAFPQVTEPNLLQCMTLGVAVAATAIIPGVDPAVFLTTLGYYSMYISALANLDFAILIPMSGGLLAGAVLISAVISLLFRQFYTVTYSVIFGIFLSMIPNMLSDSCVLGRNMVSVVSFVLMAAGFCLSCYLGDFRRYNQMIRQRAEKREEKKG
jgi:putative membrane protein